MLILVLMRSEVSGVVGNASWIDARALSEAEHHPQLGIFRKFGKGLGVIKEAQHLCGVAGFLCDGLEDGIPLGFKDY